MSSWISTRMRRACKVYVDMQPYSVGRVEIDIYMLCLVHGRAEDMWLNRNKTSTSFYISENGTPYWIIKNSWNENWGEAGYMRVQFGTNQCNLNHEPTTSVVSKTLLV